MRTIQKFLSFLIIIAITAIVAGGTMAQERRTITVSGEGTATGNADMATIEIGFTSANESISTAYSDANTTVENIINVLVEQSVAREDIRTTDFNIFTEERPLDGMTNFQRIFRVSNRVTVTVRDVDNIENVIDAAVSAGANNIFGLNFRIQDTSALESEARIEALNRARNRADEVANAIGANILEVVSVTETGDGFAFPVQEMRNMGGGIGGAVIEQGSLGVTVRVTVTYEIGQ